MEQRYDVLDTLRGITLISMIMYHGMWDLVYMYGYKINWYKGLIGYCWQQSICWTFILLSGFCWSFSRNHYKRGFIISAAGCVVSLVTVLLMPHQKILFGILTLIGACILLLAVCEKLFAKISPEIGAAIAFFGFFITRNINRGYLGFEQINLVKLPAQLYKNYITTFLGFPFDQFFSTDYFSLFPWFFLFLTGYYLHGIFKKRNALSLFEKKTKGILNFIGKHSLVIYLIHQPILYVGFNLLFH